MTAVNRFSKPCAVTDCLLQPSCVTRPLVPPPLKDTAVIINEYPAEGPTTLETITHSTEPLRGTPVSLKCGGSAYILEEVGNHLLHTDMQASGLANAATTIGPCRADGITTQVLLLAGHRIAPRGNSIFDLMAINADTAVPIAAIDETPRVVNSGRSNPWILEGTEWHIAQAIMRLTPMLPALTQGIEKALTPGLAAEASLSVFVRTGARSSQTVTVDLHSTEREDGFWNTEYWVENPFARIGLVRTLQTLGFKQR